MFVSFFLSTLAAAFVLSCLVALLFWTPVKNVLRKLLDDEAAAAWTRYACFTLVVAGVSAGARVRILEEYLTAPSFNRGAMLAELTQEFWVLEMYRTVIGTVVGIAWVLLGLSLVAGIVYVIADKYRLNRVYSGGAQRRPPDSTNRATSTR
ncbi:MAG TPA: hypothetical protein VNK47_06485 [Candidatus Dormibacteraeota bacterium]|nr:hypothetical protein [Candidatus Dormibacteraeota bacterium]